MPSRTDTAGPTRAFDYPVMEHWGGAKCLVPRVELEPTTHRFTVQRANPLSQPGSPGKISIKYEGRNCWGIYIIKRS